MPEASSGAINSEQAGDTGVGKGVEDSLLFHVHRKPLCPKWEEALIFWVVPGGSCT